MKMKIVLSNQRVAFNGLYRKSSINLFLYSMQAKNGFTDLKCKGLKWLSKSKIFTICYFTENICSSLVQIVHFTW